MNVSHRLNEFITHTGLPLMAFEKSINAVGRIQATFTTKRTGFNTDLLEKISNKYSNLNLNWLITGRGSMLIEEAAAPVATNGQGSEWREKYYAVLEKYTACMEAKEATKKPYAGNGK